MNNILRQIPPVHEMQRDERALSLQERLGLEHSRFAELIKEALDSVRQAILSGNYSGPEPGSKEFLIRLFNNIEAAAEQKYSFALQKVINATGTILHTNLGRARLSEAAVKHMSSIASSYSNLEYNLEKGSRGSRHDLVEGLVKEITGAEAAMIVNNNAAAVFLVLRALASGSEVIVSRGELVEIGGSFRISSIMQESGARLVEVGTTNKTHLRDYKEAVTEDTAMLMKVHTSNFKIVGFTKSVPATELAEEAAKSGLIYYEDLGSGVLYDYSKHGIGEEPVVSEVLKAGASIVSFSGDKLLGGPQAGIIAGQKDLIDKLKKHQLARVLRVDKMTLAALEATLSAYVKDEKALMEIPVIRDMLAGKDDLKKRAEAFAAEVRLGCPESEVRVMESTSMVGGGTMPDVELPTFAAAVRMPGITAVELAVKLREQDGVPIIARIRQEETIFDLRTVSEEEAGIIAACLSKIEKGLSPE
ncbi:L-seryl-tRNA(Sec) selenium transferase [Bacillus infantis]|uniref:L-seryl-tRNA(Sec) selenium transferase n=1 Tax=Bacillus infantis TaxID=324767 RepID=UPI001CD4D8E8|nr:L-seryl-tRNA(Sec) selenium transferase [Bacillus infantis]MCA1038010.1 L-seryl-tRNA(Sec) selenium transferase [Bacillus infantis]